MLALVNGVPLHEIDPVNVNEALLCGTISFGAFFLLSSYLTRTINVTKSNDEYGARVCSLIHAIVSTFGVGYAMCKHAMSGGTWSSPGTRLEADFIMVSAGYFASDTVLMALQKWSWMFFAHHAVALTALAWSLTPSCNFMFCVCAAIVAGECSNIWMHQRYLNRCDGRCTKLMTRLWFVTFGVARGLVCPWLVWETLKVAPIIFAPLPIGLTAGSLTVFCKAIKSEMAGEWYDL